MHRFLRDPSKMKHESQKIQLLSQGNSQRAWQHLAWWTGAGLGDVKQEAGGLRPSDPVMSWLKVFISMTAHRVFQTQAHGTFKMIALCVLNLSVLSDPFVTPWTVAHQAPLSMRFSM